MSKTRKFVLFAFLVCIILSLGATVFAVDLELNYPSIPGVGNFEQGQQIQDKGEQMAFYARYVLRLAFYLVIGVCIIVLVIAGGIYITAGAKPSAIVKAKDMVQRALLGLAILIGSYSILYLVNPQLLILQVDFQEPETIDIALSTQTEEQGVVEVVFVDPGAIAKETLENAATEIYYHEAGTPFSRPPGTIYYDDAYMLIPLEQIIVAKIPTQGLFAKILNKIKLKPVLVNAANGIEPMIYLAEQPLRQADINLKELILLVKGDNTEDNIGIETLLEGCKCGESKSHTQWDWEFTKTGKVIKTYSAVFTGTCMGGMDEAEEGLFWNDNEKTSQNICLTQTSDCGTSINPATGELNCDLREVIVKQIPILISAKEKKIEYIFIKTKEDNPSTPDDETEWALIDWNALDWDPGTWQPSGISDFSITDGGVTASLALSTTINKEKSVKYKRYKIELLIAQLEGLKDKYFPEQIGPVDKTLKNNAADYAVFNAEGLWENDFIPQKKAWEQQGLKVVIEPLKSANAALEAPLFAVSPPVEQSRFEKLVSFFVKPVSAQLEKKRVASPTGYYFAISAPEGVLPEDVLARNQFVRREAGRASLFSVLTDLSLERIQQMFQMCLISAFGAANYQVSDAQMLATLKEALRNGAGDVFVSDLTDEEILELIGAIGKTYAEKLGDKLVLACEGECGGAGNTECVDECIEKNISPEFTSRIITEFLTADIDTWFGDEVKQTLDEPIRQILGNDINAQLNKEMGKFYDAIFMGLLSQSLEDKIPKLKEVLETKLTDVKFLDVVLGRLGEVDEFLTCRLSGCCRPVSGPDECVEEIYNEIPGGDEPIRQCGVVSTNSWRNVASKNQCKTEVYREKDGKKQCCEQGLRQVVDAFSEEKVKSLARQYTTQNASELIGGLKAKMPGYFPEFRMAEACILEDGYYFRPNTDFENQFLDAENPTGCKKELTETNTGECIQMNLDEINALGGSLGTDAWNYETTKYDVIENEIGGEVCLNYVKDGFPIHESRREEICIGAGYCWSRDPEAGDVYEGDGAKECRECNWIGQGFARGEGMGGLKKGMKRVGREFVAGLINFGEQFIAALVEITLHTTIQYAKMWIEDTITAPLMPYFRQVMKFQDQLHGYLTASVKDILPGPIRDTLEKNLDTIIGDLCKMYEVQKQGCDNACGNDEACLENCKITFQFAEDDEYAWLKWKDDDGVPQDISFSANSRISDNFGGKVCKFNQHLHTTLLDEIAVSNDFLNTVVEVLNTSIKQQLQNCRIEIKGEEKTCAEILEMNLADMVFAFTPLKNLVDLINGTPKEIICGEKSIEWVKDGANVEKTPKQVCDLIQYTGQAKDLLGSGNDFYKTLLSPINLALPFINKGSPTYTGLSEAGKKFYQGYCPFIWGVCQEVSISTAIKNDGIGKITVGGTIKHLLNKTCATFDNTLKNGLIVDGQQFPVPAPPLCPSGVDCLNTPVCEGSCLSGNPTASALQVLQDDTDSQCLPAFKQTCSSCNSLINNSIAFSLFYEAIKSDFGENPYPDNIISGSDIESIWKQEAEAYQWLYIYFPDSRQDIAYVANLRNFGKNINSWQDLETKMNGIGASLDKVLVNAFINSFRTKTVKSVLLENINFLAKTPYNLLTKDVCGKIINDFETIEGLRYWSLPEVASREAANLAPAAQYSMESLDSSTLAKNLDIILHSPVPDEHKVPYLFCKTLPYSPSQITGLNQRLMTYIRPKQAQIMFQLIDDKLKRGSGPSSCKEEETFVSQGGRDECRGSYWYIVGAESECKTGESFRDQGGIKECLAEYSYLAGERPPALNALLTYLNTKTPISALMDAANGLEDEGTKEDAKKLVKFLNTPIITLIFQAIAGREALTRPIMDTICGVPVDPNSWCYQKIDINETDILNELRAFINQKPTDLIEGALAFPLIDCSSGKCDWGAAKSVMDFIVDRYPVLGQKYIDILGRQLGWDVKLLGITEEVKDAQDLVDKSIGNMKVVLQDNLNNIFIEKPAQAVEYVTMGIANLIGGEMGDNIANQLTGVCAEKDAGGNVFTESACKDIPNKVYRPATGGEPAECCDLGADVVCKPRCRPKPNNQSCKESIGEVQTVIEEIVNGAVQQTAGCCFSVDTTGNSCKTYRVISAVDDSEGRGCREDETKGEITVNNKDVAACYKLKLRTYETDTLLGVEYVIPSTDKCCTTVNECVAEQFGEHLRVLSDTMSHGSLPLDSLTGKR